MIDPTTTNALNKLKMKLAKERYIVESHFYRARVFIVHCFFSFTEQRILEAIMAQPVINPRFVF